MEFMISSFYYYYLYIYNVNAAYQKKLKVKVDSFQVHFVLFFCWHSIWRFIVEIDFLI